MDFTGTEKQDCCVVEDKTYRAENVHLEYHSCAAYVNIMFFTGCGGLRWTEETINVAK